MAYGIPTPQTLIIIIASKNSSPEVENESNSFDGTPTTKNKTTT
jgi:hypothetical protein